MTGGPRRRKTDQAWYSRLVRENWYRDVWLMAVTGIVVWTGIKIEDTARKTNENVVQVQEGRRAGTAINCATTSAVIDAGRETLLHSATIGSAKFERNLERLGLPPMSVRQAAARASAHRYAQSIARAVQKQTRIRGIISADGTLNCRALQAASKTTTKK